MDNIIRPGAPNIRYSRKSIRLTFRFANGEVRLVSYERLRMICPPSVGERPEVGRHGGFWMELRDAEDDVLFHRVLQSPLGDSVEVHSPDGRITREFGDVQDRLFEVLLPDEARAKYIVLMGESLESAETRKERAAGSSELARFDVPQDPKEVDDERE